MSQIIPYCSEVQDSLTATAVRTIFLVCYLHRASPILSVAESEKGVGNMLTVTVTDENQRLGYLALSHTSAGLFLCFPQHRNGHSVF
jgi:hypothetical protein